MPARMAVAHSQVQIRGFVFPEQWHLSVRGRPYIRGLTHRPAASTCEARRLSAASLQNPRDHSATEDAAAFGLPLLAHCERVRRRDCAAVRTEDQAVRFHLRETGRRLATPEAVRRSCCGVPGEADL